MTTPNDDTLAHARAVLGVDLGIDARSLRSAFRKRSMETHPDRQGSAAAFEEVRQAYELLVESGLHSETEMRDDSDAKDADGWLIDSMDDDLDIRIVDEEKSPRRRRFEEMFLDALRRENGE